MKITTDQLKSLMGARPSVVAVKSLCDHARVNYDAIRMRLKGGGSLTHDEELKLGCYLASFLEKHLGWTLIDAGPILDLIDEQAEDKGLWFQPEYITEDCLQKALRKLHALVEGMARKGAKR